MTSQGQEFLEAKAFSLLNGVNLDSTKDRDCECTEGNLGDLEA
jgi:hypothetical protein